VATRRPSSWRVSHRVLSASIERGRLTYSCSTSLSLSLALSISFPSARCSRYSEGLKHTCAVRPPATHTHAKLISGVRSPNQSGPGLQCLPPLSYRSEKMLFRVHAVFPWELSKAARAHDKGQRWRVPATCNCGCNEGGFRPLTCPPALPPEHERWSFCGSLYPIHRRDADGCGVEGHAGCCGT